MEPIATLQPLFDELQSSVPGLVQYLEGIAGIFQLEFNEKIFVYQVVSPEQKVMLDFLGGCPAPPHDGWENTPQTRLDAVAEFIESPQFFEYVKELRIGGSVIDKTVLLALEECVNRFSNKTWIDELFEELSKIDFENDGYIVLVFSVDPRESSLKRLQNLLIHEWIHLLFFKSGINFQDKFSRIDDVWLYDEGLATWIESHFAAGTWDNRVSLGRKVDDLKLRGAPISAFGYYGMAVWFTEKFISQPVDSWPNQLNSIMNSKDLKTPTQLLA
ncbi:hypothetical protein HOF92_07395 [bacterium]|jgi:hypothetical protein|nr:hypothetical protein [bacterium]